MKTNKIQLICLLILIGISAVGVTVIETLRFVGFALTSESIVEFWSKFIGL